MGSLSVTKFFKNSWLWASSQEEYSLCLFFLMTEIVSLDKFDNATTDFFMERTFICRFPMSPEPLEHKSVILII